MNTVVMGLLFVFSFSRLAQAQPQPFSSAPPIMKKALSSVESEINQAASTAAVLQGAAPLVDEAKRQVAAGDREKALGTLLKAQSMIQNSSSTGGEAALLRSFSRDLDQIVNSMNPAGAPDSPLFMNPLMAGESQQVIRQYIAYFQRKGRGSLETSWRRMTAYQPAVESILRERNLPTELINLGIVESGFNPLALSPKQARGIWQFIPATAYRYGLIQRGALDERTDPLKSTLAAAEYLKDLYAKFGDWYLALAAYNAGENRVQSVITRTGVRDFWEMRRRKLLPKETLRYVPAVLAVIAIARSPEHFGFVNLSRPGWHRASKEEIHPREEVDLSMWMGVAGNL